MKMHRTIIFTALSALAIWSAVHFSPSVFATDVNAPVLIAQWHFDEPVGSTTVIDTVSGLVGTLNGNATILTGSECFSGNCLHFDGNGDYVIVANDPKFNVKPEENLIVKLHFRTTVTNATMALIGNSQLRQEPNLSTRGNGWFLGYTFVASSGSKVLSIAPAFISDDGTSVSAAFAGENAVGIYQNNQWHTFESLLDNINFHPKSIVDGTIYPTVNGGYQIHTVSISTQTALVMGAHPSLLRYFYNGYLDEVEIYKQQKLQPSLTPTATLTKTPSPIATFTPINTATPTLTPTVIPSNTPVFSVTPVIDPLMCIDSRCTSSTGTMNYGSVISCEMSASGGLQRNYEGVCNVDRNGITLESITLTPISVGVSQFLPFTLTHGNADLNCKFRVCDVAGGQNQNCTTWGSSS